jgi:hypothetical protein
MEQDAIVGEALDDVPAQGRQRLLIDVGIVYFRRACAMQ